MPCPVCKHSHMLIFCAWLRTRTAAPSTYELSVSGSIAVPVLYISDRCAVIRGHQAHMQCKVHAANQWPFTISVADLFRPIPNHPELCRPIPNYPELSRTILSYSHPTPPHPTSVFCAIPQVNGDQPPHIPERRMRCTYCLQNAKLSAGKIVF